MSSKKNIEDKKLRESIDDYVNLRAAHRKN